MQTLDQILNQLRSEGGEKYKSNVVRMGIPEESSLGVPIPVIRKMGKRIGRNHRLGLDLWNSPYHEAKLLAALIIEPAETDRQVLEKLMADVASWDLCDHICKSLIIELPYYGDLIYEWAGDNRLYFKRAAFVLICAELIKFKSIEEDKIDSYLELILQNSGDSRTHVRKGINWALRDIGKFNHSCHEKAISAAWNLTESGDSDRRWIGRNALKELEKLIEVRERRRLLSSDTKVGRRNLN